MSLMRLLSSGKSWVGLKDSGIRYRMTDPRAMPKFGSDKNRFHKAAKSPPAQVKCLAPMTAASNGTKAAASAGAGRPEERFSRSNGLSTADALRLGTAALRTKGQMRRIVAKRMAQASTALLNSLRVLRLATTARISKMKLLSVRRRSRPARPEPGPFTKAPVQGELSLDRIKVVRNDLSDADLEIVPARPKATSASVETALQT